jgi:hypothetical protein
MNKKIKWIAVVKQTAKKLVVVKSAAAKTCGTPGGNFEGDLRYPYSTTGH